MYTADLFIKKLETYCSMPLDSKLAIKINTMGPLKKKKKCCQVGKKFLDQLY